MLALAAALISLLLGLNKHHANQQTPGITLRQAENNYKQKMLIGTSAVPVPNLTTPAATPINRDICIFNGTQIPQLAKTIADQLQAKGWKVASFGNYAGAPKKTTTISYPRGQLASAQALQQTYPKATDFEIQIPENTTCPGKLVLILMGK